MFVSALIELILVVLGILLSVFPAVSLPQSWLDAISYLIGLFNSFLVVFPFAQIVWNSFIYVIIPFEIALLVLKIFLGGRQPANIN